MTDSAAFETLEIRLLSRFAEDPAAVRVFGWLLGMVLVSVTVVLR